MPDKHESFRAAANESLQENLDRGEPSIFAGYGLVGAIILFGGIGYLLDMWLKTLPAFLLIGLLVGLIVGFYALLKATRRA
jgi:F0F1-type ATP synthase assembly protein I